MKIVGVTGTAVLLLLFGAVIPAWAQHEEKKEEKPAGRQEQHAQPPQRAQQQHAAQPRPQEQREAQQARPQQPQARAEQTHQTQPGRQPEQHTAPQQQQRVQQTQQVRKQPQHTQEQARAWQQQKGWAKGGGSPGHATFLQSQSRNWAADHRSWAQRGGYGGYYIPQDRFRASFGSQHFFRLGGLPVMYMGYPRFAYSGFSFLLVDPWPGDWPGNWYSADDVYIDYDNGYYLYNRSYPQERLAITIAL